MPSKPLFGMPVAVGISEAVIPMRSMVSAAAGAASASEPVNARARQAGRKLMRALLSTRHVTSFAQQEAGQRIFWAIIAVPWYRLTSLGSVVRRLHKICSALPGSCVGTLAPVGGQPTVPATRLIQRDTCGPAYSALDSRLRGNKRIMLEEARMAKLVSLSVTGASQKNVTGTDVWAAAQKKSAQVIIAVTTGPKNSGDEWKLIKWTGGTPVKGRPNQCAVDRDAPGKVTVKVEYGETARTIDIWIVSASIEILTDGPRPKGAAPRNAAMRDRTEKLGAVTFPTGFQNGIDDSIAADDPDPKHFVFSTGASGKIIA